MNELMLQLITPGILIVLAIGGYHLLQRKAFKKSLNVEVGASHEKIIIKYDPTIKAPGYILLVSSIIIIIPILLISFFLNIYYLNPILYLGLCLAFLGAMLLIYAYWMNGVYCDGVLKFRGLTLNYISIEIQEVTNIYKSNFWIVVVTVSKRSLNIPRMMLGANDLFERMRAEINKLENESNE